MLNVSKHYYFVYRKISINLYNFIFLGQYSNCRVNQFQCVNGQCIQNIDKCDGILNCTDNSDETFELCRYVQCPSFAFRCDYGACISRNRHCNGKSDCWDGSDENNCRSTEENPFINQQNSQSTEDPQSSQLPPNTQRPSVLISEQPVQTNGGNPCIIELPSRGDAFIDGIAEALKPQQQIEDGQRVYYTCTDNYYIVSGSNENRCTNGRWKNEVAICEARCSKITGITINVKCLSESNKREVECNELSLPGTEIVVTCQKGYKRSIARQNLTCTEYGRWNRLPAKCTQICGVPSYMVNSSYSVWTGDISEAPWHVGIYQNEDYQCGGTIVASKVVVTAAHCFWNIRAERLQDYRLHRVYVGKSKRGIHTPETKTYESIGIERIIYDDKYSFSKDYNQRDIAYIILQDHITFDDHIAPACFYDLYDDQIPFMALDDDSDSEIIGNVAGWGAKPRTNVSETLKMMKLEKISRRDCRTNSPENFQAFITNDKFCAGDSSSPTVCQGDSGGGFTFIQDGKHYLRGVVSIGSDLSCAETRYTTFTKVALYTKLIREYLIDFYRALL